MRQYFYVHHSVLVYDSGLLCFDIFKSFGEAPKFLSSTWLTTKLNFIYVVPHNCFSGFEII